MDSRSSFHVVPPGSMPAPPGSMPAPVADTALVPPSNAPVAEARRLSEAAVAVSPLSVIASLPAFPAAGGLLSLVLPASSVVVNSPSVFVAPTTLPAVGQQLSLGHAASSLIAVSSSAFVTPSTPTSAGLHPTLVPALGGESRNRECVPLVQGDRPPFVGALHPISSSASFSFCSKHHVATSPNSFVSGTSYFSFGRTASCGPVDQVIASTPNDGLTFPGSAQDASVSSESLIGTCDFCYTHPTLNPVSSAPNHFPYSPPASTSAGVVSSAASTAAHNPTPLEFSSQPAAAPPQRPRITRSRHARVDQSAEMQVLQQRKLQGQLPPPQASNRRPRSFGHAAAVAAVILACIVACSSAQNVAVSGGSLGGWSTAVLSQARQNLAATSLPNAGVAIFAGGQGTSCEVCLGYCRMGVCARGMGEGGGECCWLMTCACLMPCAAGSVYYSVVDLVTFCSAGFSSVVGAARCAPCQPGYFCPSPGSSSCSSCSSGSYSGSGQSACTPCPPGFFNPSPASVECFSCSPGQYCPRPGSTKGIPCNEGYFCPSGSSNQTECPRGSFCKSSAGAASPCPQNTFSDSVGLISESQCIRCPPGKDSGIGAVECSSPCIPSPWNVQTFQCYSTEGKVIVVLTWCASLFSAVFFPFKTWSMYKYRRGKLEAKGIRPTLKHLIFFRTALSRAVSLQPLIHSPGGGNFEAKPPPQSSKTSSASGGD